MAGAVMVFTLAVSAYVTPALLSGGRITVFSMLIFQQYSSVFDFHYGGALSITMLVLTLVAGRASPGASAIRGGPEHDRAPGPDRLLRRAGLSRAAAGRASSAASLTTTSFLAFPPQGLTLAWYGKMLGDPSYVSAFATSTVLAVAATVVAMVLAVPAALAIARYRFPGRGLLSADVDVAADPAACRARRGAAAVRQPRSAWCAAFRRCWSGTS